MTTAVARRYTSRSKVSRPNAMDHKFGPDLVCTRVGCDVEWGGHQNRPTTCLGIPGSPHLTPLGRRIKEAKVPYWKVGKASGYASTTVGRVLTPKLWPGLLPATIERVTKEAEALLVEYGAATRGEFATTPLLLESGLPAAPA